MNRYLVLQLARFGDIIQSKRLMLTLAEQGEVHLAVDESLSGLAALIYPGAVIHAVKAHAGGVSAADVLSINSRAFAALQSVEYTQVYNLNRTSMALALAGLFAPETVIGYRMENRQPTASTWTKMGARWTKNRRSSPINLMDFWAFFHPSPIAAEKVNPIARPKNAPGTAQGQRIGVVLSGRESRRSLPSATLAPVLEALFSGRKGPSFVLLGTKNEEDAARLVLKNLRPATAEKTENLAGKTGLLDLPDIVQGLDLLLTPDTGTMHLAAHLGVPVMATFLSSAWAWETGPYGLGHQVWQSAAPCAPCLESRPCPRKTACLEVFKSPDLLEHLAGRHSGSWPDSLLGLVSNLDNLGVTYLCVDGDDTPLKPEERLAKRALLAEYLGLLAPNERPFGIPAHISGDLLAETDWMLPDYGWSDRSRDEFD